MQPDGNTLYQDPFDELASSWGNFENYHVENGKLIIQPPAGYNTSTLNSASLYDDVDVCVEMTVAPPVKKGNCGGIIFWAVDFDNLYTFQVSTDGTAAVWRRQKGKWLTQIQLQDFSAVRKAANQINELRVTTVGNKAKFFVNGKPFKELTGQPPTGGSQIGLIGCAPSNVSARVGFDNLVVSGPGGGGARRWSHRAATPGPTSARASPRARARQPARRCSRIRSTISRRPGEITTIIASRPGSS